MVVSLTLKGSAVTRGCQFRSRTRGTSSGTSPCLEASSTAPGLLVLSPLPLFLLLATMTERFLKVADGRSGVK